MIKWLYQIKQTEMTNNTFLHSLSSYKDCQNINFEITQWLHQIKPTIQLTPECVKYLLKLCQSNKRIIHFDQFLWFHNTFVANNVHCKFFLLCNFKRNCLSEYIIRNICLFFK